MNEQDWTIAESDVDEAQVDVVEFDDVEADDVEADAGAPVVQVVAVSDTAAIEDDAEDDGSDLEDVLVLEVVDDALVLPVWEPTGVARVDEALDELTRLDPDDVHHHAEVYDTIHQRLRGTLSDLDTPV